MFRADAAFAMPEIYEALEARGVKCHPHSRERQPGSVQRDPKAANVQNTLFASIDVDGQPEIWKNVAGPNIEITGDGSTTLDVIVGHDVRRPRANADVAPKTTKTSATIMKIPKALLILSRLFFSTQRVNVVPNSG